MTSAMRSGALVAILAVSIGSPAPGRGEGPSPPPSTALPPPAAEDTTPGDTAINQAELREIVWYLASPALTGRGSCPEEGAVAAAAFVAEAFRQSGLEPAGEGGYLQPFDCPAGSHSYNVVGHLPGSDPALLEQPILIGAHHDHLGTGERGYYPGADDNASGVAVLLEVAEALAANPTPLRRPVTFVSFGAEERGRIGSRHYALAHQSPLMMINLDMVGHLSTGGLRVYGGSGTARLANLVREVAGANATLSIELTPSAGCGSDQEPFVERGTPSLFLHTGVHSRYHSRRDTPDSLDYPGLTLIARFVRDLLLQLANADELPVTPRPPLDCHPAASFAQGFWVSGAC